jgi:hypothetical protein
MADFPNQVNVQNAPAVEGDFASANPRTMVLAGEGALKWGDAYDTFATGLVGGVIAGRWGWLSASLVDNDEAPAVVNCFGSGKPQGIVHRSQQGLITRYLATASMVFLKGQQAELFHSADIWIKNRGATYAQVGMKAFANFADGTTYFAAAGATPAGGSGSASSIAAATFSATGSIADNVLSVTAVGAGTLYAGATFSGSGVATGTKIVQQLTSTEVGGTLGGKGTYAVNIPEQVVASTALSGTYGVLTIGGTVVAGLGQGQTISGTNVVAGTTVYQQLTGTTGAAGTYVVDNNTVVSSTAITSQSAIETDFYAWSAGAANELVKISRMLYR